MGKSTKSGILGIYVLINSKLKEAKKRLQSPKPTTIKHYNVMTNRKYNT
jgi:hypothetical protein